MDDLSVHIPNIKPHKNLDMCYGERYDGGQKLTKLIVPYQVPCGQA